MRKRLPEIQEESAQDSFLDVIANLVGVIIILVMLVGARATRDVMRGTPLEPETVAASETSPPELPVTEKGPGAKTEEQLNDAKAAAISARNEVEELATRLVRMKQESAELDAERVTLAMHRSIVEEDIAKRRARLDSDKQKEFDVQRQLAEAQMKLDKLMQEHLGLLDDSETVEEVENAPTPLSRIVKGDAIHLRLKNGLVSVVPYNELRDEIESHAPDIMRRLESKPEVSETVGPINGYRMRFTISKTDATSSIMGPRAGQVQRQVIDDFAFEVLPMDEVMGQEVKLALAPGGSVHEYLISNHRKSQVVLVWLYDDSYADCRHLKRSLWEMGFSVDIRPRPEGMNIIGGMHGSAIDAQ